MDSDSNSLVVTGIRMYGKSADAPSTELITRKGAIFTYLSMLLVVLEQ